MTPTFSGVDREGDKIRSGYPTPAFSGAKTKEELLRNRYILGDPQQRGQNQKWLPHPCLLKGPQVGRIATSPLLGTPGNSGAV